MNAKNDVSRILKAYSHEIIVKEEVAKGILYVVAEGNLEIEIGKLLSDITSEIKVELLVQLDHIKTGGFHPQLVGGSYSQSEIACMRNNLAAVEPQIREYCSRNEGTYLG